MKKFLVFLLSIITCFSLFSGCAGGGNDLPPDNGGNEEDVGGGVTGGDTNDQQDWLTTASTELKTNLSADGYVRNSISDFSQYVGTAAYRTVSNADELALAIKDAGWHYKTTWNSEDKTISQSPADGYTEQNFKGTVRVIEITNDIDLGYNKLSSTAKESGVIQNNVKTNNAKIYTMSSMYNEYGISELKIQNINDLLIYSKNGAKITHATMNVMACSNVAFRNLQFDEIWQWEDSASATAPKVGDYDSQKWAYFKLNFCGYIWIDHCTFGKSFDGLIDYANPVYNATEAMANGNRAPYGLTDERGIHISWCNFAAGSDDEDGYIYKMMSEIEENYQANKKDESVTCNYLYYKALRDSGCTFETILYGMAIPQKKAFLCGDSGNNKEDYEYNRQIKISIANCYFKNIEDRIPKLRGGNCYFYNNIVDCFQYYSYRNKLSAFASAVSSVNSNWKCACVSQCLLSSNGASLMAESCIFRGVSTLIKNNDKVIVLDGVDIHKAYYKISNCSYQLTKDSKVILSATASKSDNNPFASNNAALTEEGFSWHATNGKQPFEICATVLRELEGQLTNETYGVGARAAMGEKCLKSNYNA